MPSSSRTSKPYHFVLLRGLIRDQRHWFKFKELLQETFQGCLVTPVDFPGVGFHHHLCSPYRIREILNFSRAQILKSLNLHSETHTPILISISLGAMVGLDWCDQYPQDFRQAFFINTSARNLGSLFERFNPLLLPRILFSFLYFKPEMTEKIVLNATTQLLSREQKKTTLHSLIQFQKEKPASKITFLRQIIAGSKFHHPYNAQNKIKVPVVILACLRDRLVSYQCSVRLSQALGAPLMTHPTAGHDLSTDDPQWLLEQVQKNLI